MQLDDFKPEATRLSNWFGKKLSPEQIVIMHDGLKHIPLRAFARIVTDLIESSKYFPTINDIKNEYRENWQKNYPEEGRARYREDETEDQYYRRVSVQLLWEGLRIYKRDAEALPAWAAQNHISTEDIERIEAKANLQTHKALPAAEKLAERVAEEVTA